MDNPITRIRRELGLSRREFCVAAGIRRDALYLVETAQVNRPQQRILAFLQRAGYHPEDLVREYRAYRERLASQALAGVKRCGPA